MIHSVYASARVRVKPGSIARVRDERLGRDDGAHVKGKYLLAEFLGWRKDR